MLPSLLVPSGNRIKRSPDLNRPESSNNCWRAYRGRRSMKTVFCKRDKKPKIGQSRTSALDTKLPPTTEPMAVTSRYDMWFETKSAGPETSGLPLTSTSIPRIRRHQPCHSRGSTSEIFSFRARAGDCATTIKSATHASNMPRKTASAIGVFVFCKTSLFA